MARAILTAPEDLRRLGVIPSSSDEPTYPGNIAGFLFGKESWGLAVCLSVFIEMDCLPSLSERKEMKGRNTGTGRCGLIETTRTRSRRSVPQWQITYLLPNYLTHTENPKIAMKESDHFLTLRITLLFFPYPLL